MYMYMIYLFYSYMQIISYHIIIYNTVMKSPPLPNGYIWIHIYLFWWLVQLFISCICNKNLSLKKSFFVIMYSVLPFLLHLQP